MQESLVSIIVPVYKVEKYIKRCLNSIVNQTYQNIEVILVDDGSPDDCGKICDQYSQNDRRIKVIHKSNGGVSSARNAGLQAVTGKYIQFIDSDDYIKEDFIEFKMKIIEKYNCDLLISGYTSLDNNEYTEVKVEKDQIYSRDDFFKNIGQIRCGLLLMWNKLFSLEKIHQGQLQFDESISLGEDSSFTLDYFKITQCIGVVNDTRYIYTTREDSLGHRINFPINGHVYYNHFLNFLTHFMTTELQINAHELMDVFLFTAVNNKIGYEVLRKDTPYHIKKKNIMEVLINPAVKIAYTNPHNVNKFTKILLPFYRMQAVNIIYIIFKLKYFIARNFLSLYKKLK